MTYDRRPKLEVHPFVSMGAILNSGEVRFIRPITETLSGDEIIFQNKLPFQIQL